MAESPLGKTLVIANPASHSGRGADGAAFAERFLQSYRSATHGFKVVLTKAPKDAIELAASAMGYSTVIALGGDGVIHEVVNGLMTINEAHRPQLALIPFGSGNDYARTLSMARDDVSAAIAQLVRGITHTVDLAQVNGVYAMETLSFGLDAAISHDTMRRRNENSAQEGEGLFITSALKLLTSAGSGYPCTITFDNDKPQRLSPILCAFQLGPTYGGGFKVCPRAKIDDGLLDVCYNTKTPRLPGLISTFLRMRWGAHENSRIMCLRTVKKAHLVFDKPVPAQVDGELLEGKEFTIRVIPAALKVIKPAVSTL